MMQISTLKVLLSACLMSIPFLTETATAASSQQKNYAGRDYTIVFPDERPGDRKYPLLLLLHGGLGNSSYLERVLPFNRMAKRQGFVLVYPNGNPLRIAPRRKVWNAGGCCGRAAFDDLDDVGYLSGLIRMLAEKLPVNRRKIYMMGHSNGAMMAYRFACERPGVLAGIIPVSGPLMTETCRTSSVRVLHIHGEHDDRVPVEGRRRIRPLVQNRPYRSVRETVRIMKDAGARVQVKIVKGAGHNIREIDDMAREQYSLGIPGLTARFMNGMRK